MYLEPCRYQKRSLCENSKTTKAPSQTYAVVLNTQMLRDNKLNSDPPTINDNKKMFPGK